MPPDDTFEKIPNGSKDIDMHGLVQWEDAVGRSASSRGFRWEQENNECAVAILLVASCALWQSSALLAPAPVWMPLLAIGAFLIPLALLTRLPVSVELRATFAIVLVMMMAVVFLRGKSNRDLVRRLDSTRHEIESNLEHDLTLEGRVASPPERKRHGEVSFVVRVRPTPGTSAPATPILFRLIGSDLPWKIESTLKEGDRIQATVGIVPSNSSIENPFSFDAWLARRGIAFSGRVKTLELKSKPEPNEITPGYLEGLFTRLNASPGKLEALGVLLAAVIGDGAFLGREVVELFKLTGTTHLIVVSGFHVGVVFALSTAACGFYYRRRRRLLIQSPLQSIAPILGVLNATVYCYALNWPLTAVRALTMLGVYATGQILARRNSAAATLGISFFLVVVIWPGCFFEASCQLTFAALFGLYLAGRWNSLVRILWCERYPLDPELQPYRWKLFTALHRKLLSPFSSCLGAFITTAPIVICWFSSCAPFSVAINLIAIPLFTVGCLVAGGIALTLDWIGFPGSEAVLGLSLSSTKFFLTVLKILSNCRDYLPGGYLEFNPADAKLRAAYFSLLIPLFWFTPDLILRRCTDTFSPRRKENLLTRPSEV